MKAFFFAAVVVWLSAVAWAGPACVTKEGCVIAISEEIYDRVGRFAADKDYAAIQKLVDAGLVAQAKGGMRVFVEDHKFLSGKVKVRREGQTGTVWTSLGMLTCD